MVGLAPVSRPFENPGHWFYSLFKASMPETGGQQLPAQQVAYAGIGRVAEDAPSLFLILFRKLLFRLNAFSCNHITVNIG